MHGGMSNRCQLVQSTKERKWMLFGLIFSTFFESDLVFVVAYALLYGIHYIITIRPKLGGIRSNCMKGLGAVLSCGLIGRYVSNYYSLILIAASRIQGPQKSTLL